MKGETILSIVVGGLISIGASVLCYWRAKREQHEQNEQQRKGIRTIAQVMGAQGRASVKWGDEGDPENIELTAPLAAEHVGVTPTIGVQVDHVPPSSATAAPTEPT